jgi:hypothetical protein
VLAGISVLCFGCGAIGTAGSGVLSGMQRNNVNGVDAQEASRQISAATPGWEKALGFTTLGINLIAAILVIVLLALPAANAFFSRTRQVAEPPIPGLAYPPVPGSEPGYPSVPGNPPPPTGQPPAPGGGPGEPPQAPPA